MEAQLTGKLSGDDDLVAWVRSGAIRDVDVICAWDARLTDRGARAIADAGAALAYVDLSWNHIGGGGAALLAGAGVRRLRLYHNSVGDGTHAIAAAGERLELLNLCGNALGDVGLAALAGGRLAHLTELALGWNELGTVAAIAAGPWRDLERLNVRANRLRDASPLLAGGLPKLVWLGIDENPLGDAGLAALLAAPGFARLAWLNLGGTELDDAAVARFAGVGRCALRELRLHDNDLSPAAIAGVRAALPGCVVRA